MNQNNINKTCRCFRCSLVLAMCPISSYCMWPVAAVIGQQRSSDMFVSVGGMIGQDGPKLPVVSGHIFCLTSSLADISRMKSRCVSL